MIGFLISCVGAWVLWRRVGRLPSRLAAPPSLPSLDKESAPLVSIIVPARNEARILGTLLDSLSKLTYPRYEVIVVDDQSTDGTGDVARRFPFVKVIAGTELPPSWNGKNWACHQGAQAAQGEFLLFTDADTRHRPDSVQQAIAFFESQKADLISALPYHDNLTWWEKMLGPFHALLFVATDPVDPRMRRVFAVGQYLLFRRSSYARIGGHERIASLYPDDLSLANACMGMGGRYAIHMGSPLFDVRLYDSFEAFVQGWRRNILAGVQQTAFSAVVDVTCVIFALLGVGINFYAGLPSLAPWVVTSGVILWRQNEWGRFSLAGPLFSWFSVLLSIVISLLAFWDRLTGNVLRWKERNYQGWVQPSEKQ